ELRGSRNGLREAAGAIPSAYSPGRAWRIVADLDRHLQLVGELLQLDLPQASAHIVGAAAVRRDRQLTHIGIALASDPRDPGADRSDRELGGVVVDADADPGGSRCSAASAILRAS